MKEEIRNDESLQEYRIRTDPHRKPTHDLSIRLGDLRPLKDKLKKIAAKNNMSLNKLLIFIIESFFVSYEKGEGFIRKLE